MRQKLTYEQTIARLHEHYQSQMKNLAKLERKYLDMPSNDLFREICELRGYLSGVKATLAFVNERMADVELDMRLL